MSGSLEDLLAEFVERREAGESLTAAGFAAQHPSLGPALVQALERLGAAEELFPAGPALPSVLGGWTLGEELGRGGMGRVFRVRRADDPGAPDRALKLLAAGGALDERAAARIRREGELLRSLDHPGLVHVHDLGDGDHGPWIVMELLEGQPLSRLLSAARAARAAPPLDVPGTAPDPWRRVAALGAAVTDALAAAHQAGLLHRDVKPSNIMLRADGAPVLIDFGLAVIEGSSTLTHTGDLLGTPHYMAPEQARGERADARTDVWGLAATLHELCTLRPPIADRDALAALEQLRSRRPRRLAGERGVPQGLARVLDGALAFHPDRRTQTARLLADDLARCAHGAAPRARRAGLVERVEDAARARPRTMAAAGAGVVVALVALAALLLYGPAEPALDLEAMALAALRDGTRAHLARDDAGLLAAAERLEDVRASGMTGLEGRAALLRGARDASELPLGHVDPLIANVAAGLAALADDRAEDAIPPLREAALVAGDWALPLVLLGEAARETRDLETCEREWTSAVRLAVDSPHLFRRLGKVRRGRGDDDGAARAFRRACELDPADWRNSAELARSLVELGTPDARQEALAAIDVAFARCADPPLVLFNVKGAILDGEDRREEAREIYRQGIARHPEHFGSRFNLAYSLDLDCQLLEARDVYQQAVELRKDSVEAQFALAKIATGSDQETCEHCAAAVRSHPELVDPDEAATRLEAALRADDGSRDWLQREAARLAIKARRTGELADVLSDLLADHEEVDAWTVRLERTLREMRRHGQ